MVPGNITKALGIFLSKRERERERERQTDRQSCTGNMTRNKQSDAILDLKLEWCSASVVQGDNYQKRT